MNSPSTQGFLLPAHECFAPFTAMLLAEQTSSSSRLSGSLQILMALLMAASAADGVQPEQTHRFPARARLPVLKASLLLL